MRRDTRPAGRAGFTLIELLIVIAILALLAALVAAGIGRVRDGQQARVTDQTLTKLQLALDQQWKAVCDQCRDDRRSYTQTVKHPEFVKVVEICDRDVDRAEGLWMYLNLRRNMPQSFAEARTPVVLTGRDSSNNVVTVTLPASTAFKEVQANATAGGDPFSESAALLFVILRQGGRGTNFALEDATQGAQTSITFTGGLTLPAFKDSYGVPIAFRRFYQDPELDRTPYVRSGLSITDPLDPVGRLKNWPNANNRAEAVKAVFRTPAPPAGSATDFDGRNKVATVISAGPDSRDQPETGKTAAFTTGTTNGEDHTADDNAYGYRLTRQGNKGD